MSYKITATKRRKKSPDKIRQENKIPAVVYGPDVESEPISVDSLSFKELYQEAGVSNLIDLKVGDKDLKVLIQDIQYDPVQNSVIHADFKQIPMGEEIEASIPVEFKGVAPAVKAHGAVLLKQLDKLEVSCLPGDLIDHIEVDLSQLEEIDDSIFVRDLEVPKDITVKESGDVLVVKAAEVTVEEIEEEEEEEMTIEDVEVEGEEAEEELEEEELEELEEEAKQPQEEAETEVGPQQ